MTSRTVLSNYLKSLPDAIKCVIETSLVYHRYTTDIPDYRKFNKESTKHIFKFFTLKYMPLVHV